MDVGDGFAERGPRVGDRRARTVGLLGHDADEDAGQAEEPGLAPALGEEHPQGVALGLAPRLRLLVRRAVVVPQLVVRRQLRDVEAGSAVAVLRPAGRLGEVPGAQQVDRGEVVCAAHGIQ